MGHGPLGQAGVPDQELIEPHGVSRGSRSKDNGPVELGALNQESMVLHRVPYSGLPAGPLYGGPSRDFIQRFPDGPSAGGPQLVPQIAGPSLALKWLVPAGIDRALNR